MDFQELLQDAEQMTAQMDKENAGLPRLQRTLHQLCEGNKQKLAKTSNYTAADANGVNASILLAARGIDAPRLTQSIDGLRAPAPHAPAAHLDADYEPVSTIDRWAGFFFAPDISFSVLIWNIIKRPLEFVKRPPNFLFT